MNRFLFVFGYESPGERVSNTQHGTDFESSEAVWIRATSETEAMLKGRAYAKGFVAGVYREAKTSEKILRDEGFAHWISKKPEEEFPDSDLSSLDEI